MIENMPEAERIEAIQALITRIEYTESTIEPLCVGEGKVQLDSAAVANLILHTVLNQLTLMNTLKSMLLKEGEKVTELPSLDNTVQN